MVQKVLISIIVLSSILISTPVLFAQDITASTTIKNIKDTIDPDYFSYETMALACIVYMNEYRQLNGSGKLEYNATLELAAKEQAEEMVRAEDYKFELEDSRSIMSDYEGTWRIDALSYRYNMKNKKIYFTYKELAQNAIDRIIKSDTRANMAEAVKHSLIGVGSSLDDYRKKVYIAIFLGNDLSLNPGISRLEELEYPITEKSYGLEPYDIKACKYCSRIAGIENWQKGLSVDEGFIYFKTDDLKSFKYLIKKDKDDGIAVDIVQKSQYPCIGENITDNNLLNRGILTKRMYSNDIYNSNLIEGKDAKKLLEVELGEIPFEIEDYELHLVVIKDRHVCKRLTPNFIIRKGKPQIEKPELLADTVTIFTDVQYLPVSETFEFDFTIPCELKKIKYSNEEVEQYLEIDGLPDYIIKNLNIVAYTSIEETSSKNIIFQHQRAESIRDAIAERQEEEIEVDIIAKEAWDNFKIEIINTEFEYIAEMSLLEAKNYIKRNSLEEKLRPILEKGRFARVMVRASFDLRGQKEAKYVIYRFKEAIERNDLAKALSIQKYIFKNVMNGKYTADDISNMKIPYQPQFAGLIMNKLWLDKHFDRIDQEELQVEVEKLNALDPTNPYIMFNHVLCTIINSSYGGDYDIYKGQSKIEKLYRSTISKSTIDRLNLKYQFGVIKHLSDYEDKPSPVLAESLNRIKSIVNLNTNTWESALKLSYLFIDHDDYFYATQLLAPFVSREIVDEELLFTFLSLCSFSDEYIYSPIFSEAIKKAEKLNHKRLCKLFNGNYFSVVVYENSEVKKFICETCK